MHMRLYRTDKKRAGGFLIEHVPTNVGQAHGNGRLAGGKREVSKQFKCHTSKKGKTHYHSMNRQCLTGMLISLYVPNTMNKYMENRTIIISALKTIRKKSKRTTYLVSVWWPDQSVQQQKKINEHKPAKTINTENVFLKHSWHLFGHCFQISFSIKCKQTWGDA